MNTDTPEHASVPALPVCPGCGSTSVQAVTDRGKTYSPGLGLLGCLVAPGAGLLAGFLGATSDRTEILCLACGKRYAPPRPAIGPVIPIVLCSGAIMLLLIWAFAADHSPTAPITDPPPTARAPAAGSPVRLVPSAPAAPAIPEPVPELALPAPVFEPPPTPAIGMSFDQVTTLLGPPASTSGTTLRGLRHDIWVYPGGKRLHFEAGILRLFDVKRPGTASITPNP